MSLYGRVKKTYAYGQIFGYQRSLPELYFWLLGSKKVPLTIFKKKLGKKKEIFKKKKKINPFSAEKEKMAKIFLEPVFRLPFIYFVGLTGSVSANNAKNDDDIDIFIITSPHTLWVARPVILLYLELIKKRRKRSTNIYNQKDLICSNLWIDASNLTLPKNKRNLYTAHEVLQVLPIYDKNDTYYRFVQSNLWVKKYLANAYSKKNKKQKQPKVRISLAIFLIPLNGIMFLLQFFFMLPLTKGESVSYTQAFFHDQKFSKKVLSKV